MNPASASRYAWKLEQTKLLMLRAGKMLDTRPAPKRVHPLRSNFRD